MRVVDGGCFHKIGSVGQTDGRISNVLGISNGKCPHTPFGGGREGESVSGSPIVREFRGFRSGAMACVPRYSGGDRLPVG
jgi:hypothetical protein